ncbi:MAG: hypothetical protein A2445_02540 [Candidatus Jacksonbacteria bacterium RIFOXYC2_FULL_44_29]|nr:MAG: hypothetical protein A2240_02800 [Candidatus Jacksonbacteria bacterium RIFOXYA2_FULL_43_12]OGY78176.1 MAG: hypothetical protein A2550_06095 [Candidatus Jacksonbacteria bacterium RIFOXYD2_FULL_43_21]OGY80753.1 MAG: hypothetical protein A2445_02540 [Candidatus Jacksonbacteria bacterium RIFOXYC2_FULL_44_29]
MLAYLTYRHTSWGIYGILATIQGYLIRTEIWIIPTTWLELAIYTIALVSLIKHLREETLETHWYYALHLVRPYIIPVIVLIVSMLISIIISDNQLAALGIFKAWLVDPLLFCLIFLDAIKPEQKRQIMFFLTVSTWPIMLYGFWEYVKNTDQIIPGRLDSFFNSPNFVAMYLVPLVVLILGFLILSRRHRHSPADQITGFGKLQTIYYFCWLGVALLTLLLTKSFGGWLALALGLAFLFLFIPKFNLKKMLTASIVLIISLTLGWFVYQKSISHYDSFWRTNSWQTRQAIWINSLKLLVRDPILGVGLADFQPAYQNFVTQLPKNQQPAESSVPEPHNLYLAWWLQTGLLGLVAFFWLILIFYLKNLDNYFKKSLVLTIPALAALFAILAHGLVDTPYFKNDLSLLFWILLIFNLPQTQNSK